MFLKDVGAPITVIRIHQEDVSAGLTGELLFEYEVPLNCQMEKLQPKFTALAFLDSGEFVGFHFNSSVADCSLFNMKLSEVVETLDADGLKNKALRAVAEQREQQIRQAQIKLAKDIKMDILLKGTGTSEHERELYKLLAVAGISLEDL